MPRVEGVAALLSEAFPLCQTAAFDIPSTNGIAMVVVDSGGLEARENISYKALVTNDRVAIGEALGRLSDVFETPSHWMAL